MKCLSDELAVLMSFYYDINGKCSPDFTLCGFSCSYFLSSQDSRRVMCNCIHFLSASLLCFLSGCFSCMLENPFILSQLILLLFHWEIVCSLLNYCPGGGLKIYVQKILMTYCSWSCLNTWVLSYDPLLAWSVFTVLWWFCTYGRYRCWADGFSWILDAVKEHTDLDVIWGQIVWGKFCGCFTFWFFGLRVGWVGGGIDFWVTSFRWFWVYDRIDSWVEG